ncbi:MAG: hypothetical protein JSY10_02375 [Paenibacillus sp.]|nr:hypothetical protein [Paenibacillus sp.]
MNEPKTPNLGLNKIDRSSPSTTYFDLDKYLDQNWEKVDGFAEQVEEKVGETAAQVSGIQGRLDTEKRRSVTLEPGLQIINAERASPFKLEGLKGRTLVNLLGRIGGMESLTGLSRSYTTLALDSINKTSGANGLKITNLEGASTASAGLAYTSVTGLRSGRYYVLIADAKNIDAESGLQIGFGGSFGGSYSSAVKSTDKFVTIWAKKQLSAVTNGNVDLAVVGSVGRSGFFDSVRLYEIGADEYDLLDNMTSEEVATKYPYVDSVQPVRNPYAIRYGENLLPPVYEWVPLGNVKVDALYEVTITSATADVAAISYDVPVIPNTDYTLSVDQNGATISVTGGPDGSIIAINTAATSVSFNTGERKIVRVYLSNYIVDSGTPGIGTFTFKNPKLTLGTSAKMFKPSEGAMLGLQTYLFADPLTGANADEVFEKDGQFFKLMKWQMVTIEGSKILPNPVLSPHIGFKTIYPKLEGANYAYSSETATAAVKFDGKILIWGSHEAAADAWAIDKLNNNFAISVSNTDSGWGDLYTPTADEIKAFFMGWRMFDATIGGSELYNRSDGDRKAWIRISDWSGRVDGVVPTTNAPNWTPYQLVYQLATPTVEPITSEGQLTLIEGDNQVEVGTGIVLHEKVNPYANSGIDQAGLNAPSSPNYPGTELKAKVRKLRTIYKNGMEDNNWAIKPSAGINGGGEEYADIKLFQYDRSATYTVTYFMLDTSPIASFVGTVDETEKALLDSLIKNLKDVNTAVPSVIGKANALIAQGLNDAKNYADSNFRKPSEIVNANLVKNSTGQMGLTYWTNLGDVPFLSYEGNPTVGSFFGVVNAISTQQYAVLDSENIGVTPGGTYLLQGMFHTAGSNSNASVRIEVKDGNPAVDVNIAYLSADPAKWWHRKSMFIAIPAGVTSVKLRLVLSNVNYATKGFSRISLTETIQDVPYSMDRDIRALYEQNELVKQSGVNAKNRIVGAINAKGGSASANDTWPMLETKVRGIETGPKYATGLVTTGAGVFTINAYDGQTYSTAIVIVTGLGFKPNRIVIESVANQSYGFVTTFPSSSGLSLDGKQTYFIGGLNYANSKVDGVNSYVIDGGFRLGVYGTNREFRWHAYG